MPALLRLSRCCRPAVRSSLAGATKFAIRTDASLVAADTHNSADLYLRNGGSWTLLTPGTAQYPQVLGISPDLSRAYFVTTENIDPSDTDGGQYDVYMGSGGI